mmetsp:Transcript_99853/g.263744  ORF Transcript_99853/g.263744 Transcript_99853/m.263744 type:complete len:240 (+) Transcript_99853:2-721(+)
MGPCRSNSAPCKCTHRGASRCGGSCSSAWLDEFAGQSEVHVGHLYSMVRDLVCVFDSGDLVATHPLLTAPRTYVPVGSHEITWANGLNGSGCLVLLVELHVDAAGPVAQLEQLEDRLLLDRLHTCDHGQHAELPTADHECCIRPTKHAARLVLLVRERIQQHPDGHRSQRLDRGSGLLHLWRQLLVTPIRLTTKAATIGIAAHKPAEARLLWCSERIGAARKCATTAASKAVPAGATHR